MFKINLLLTPSSILIIYIINCSLAFAVDKPIEYRWNKSRYGEMLCFAYSKIDNSLLNRGDSVSDHNCSSKKPVEYRWNKSRYGEMLCYAYSKIDNSLLNGGDSVSDHNCDPIHLFADLKKIITTSTLGTDNYIEISDKARGSVKEVEQPENGNNSNASTGVSK